MKNSFLIFGVLIGLSVHLMHAQSYPNYKQFGTQMIDASDPKNLEFLRGSIAWVQNGLVGLNAEKPTSSTVIESHIVDTDWVFDRLVAVTNFPSVGNATVGQNVAMRMFKIGVFRGFEGKPIDLYDCGVRYVPPPLTPEQIAAREKAKADAKVKAAEQKKKAAEIALKSNQDAAAKGDTFGLLRMGQRYRDGDGVEKDLVKAKEYLQKAADAGSPTAAEELSKFKQ